MEVRRYCFFIFFIVMLCGYQCFASASAATLYEGTEIFSQEFFNPAESGYPAIIQSSGGIQSTLWETSAGLFPAVISGMTYVPGLRFDAIYPGNESWEGYPRFLSGGVIGAGEEFIFEDNLEDFFAGCGERCGWEGGSFPRTDNTIGNIVPNPVPEPGTMTLLGFGLGFGWVITNRHRWARWFSPEK